MVNKTLITTIYLANLMQLHTYKHYPRFIIIVIFFLFSIKRRKEYKNKDWKLHEEAI